MEGSIYATSIALAVVETCNDGAFICCDDLDAEEAEISLCTLLCNLTNSGHRLSILVRMNLPACSLIAAMMLRDPLTMYASESKRREVTSGHNVLMSGKNEFSCFARKGMVVLRSEKRDVRREGEEEER